MKPESARFSELARIVTARANIMLGVGWNEDAAREAYLTCFPVAQTHHIVHGGIIREYWSDTPS